MDLRKASNFQSFTNLINDQSPKISNTPIGGGTSYSMAFLPYIIVSRMFLPIPFFSLHNFCFYTHMPRHISTNLPWILLPMMIVPPMLLLHHHSLTNTLLYGYPYGTPHPYGTPPSLHLVLLPKWCSSFIRYLSSISSFYNHNNASKQR